ncbi:MAG TPA: peptidylprolyl isomerase [Labilithrix sp.]|nr:peptidylprolyl isomerase [Labilithrix sp.]
MSAALRPVATALAALLVAACSGAAGTRATATSADPAHTAVQATEPRSGDATASEGAALPPPVRPDPAPPSTGAAGTGKSVPRADDPSAPTTTAAAVETAPPKKISARHVLVQWMGTDRAGKSVLRTREQALLLIQEVQRRAKAGDDLGRLAVEYSDEPNAGARGGSLGRFGRGQMVGAFEVAVFKLKVGEISDIVETPFGFHIIQRTE